MCHRGRQLSDPVFRGYDFNDLIVEDWLMFFGVNSVAFSLLGVRLYTSCVLGLRPFCAFNWIYFS